MRISKFLTVALALSTAAAGSLFARPDSDVQAKARAALREAESDQTSTNTVAPAAKTTPAPMIKPAATRQMPPAATDSHVVQTAPPPRIYGRLSPEDEARARAALDAQLHQSGSTPAMADTTTSAHKTYTPMNSRPYQTSHTVYSTPAPVSTPQPAPAMSSMPMTAKQRELADLLQRYKMDQITPDQYFHEKAKILAEPEK